MAEELWRIGGVEALLRDLDGTLYVGAIAAAREYASDEESSLVGKPSPEFYRPELGDLRVEAKKVASIGDDIDNDVGAARLQGMAAILVKTGKYRTSLARESGIVPDFVLESVKFLSDLF